MGLAEFIPTALFGWGGEFCSWKEALCGFPGCSYDPRDENASLSPSPPSLAWFSAAGIPTLVILDPKGEVITRQGRVEVLNDLDCREFPWYPKPVLELTEANAVHLNEGPCLVLFVGMEPSGSQREDSLSFPASCTTTGEGYSASCTPTVLLPVPLLVRGILLPVPLLLLVPLI